MNVCIYTYIGVAVGVAVRCSALQHVGAVQISADVLYIYVYIYTYIGVAVGVAVRCSMLVQSRYLLMYYIHMYIYIRIYIYMHCICMCVYIYI